MSSSISSSNPLAWRRWLRLWLGAAAGGVIGLFLLVAVVDPWDALPLSPPLPRVPISSNARYSFPALARSPRFDAALLGTSTARLLRPAALDGLFGGARFVNLAMNAATAYEQVRLLGVFVRAHPHPRAVLIGLDYSWCVPELERYTPRPFPEWMYEPGARWAGYREVLQPYAVQEAVSQLATMLGLKQRRYGLDGYTRFVPPDSDYDPARVDRAFARWPLPDAGSRAHRLVSAAFACARPAAPGPGQPAAGHADGAVLRSHQRRAAGRSWLRHRAQLGRVQGGCRRGRAGPPGWSCATS